MKYMQTHIHAGPELYTSRSFTGKTKIYLRLYALIANRNQIIIILKYYVASMEA